MRAHVFGLREGHHPGQKDGARLSDPSPHQALDQWGRGQRVDGAASRRLPEHGDLVRIATELGDVIPHPLERRKLVQRPIVAGGAMFGFRGQLRMRKPAKDAQPVVGAHYHHTLLRQGSAVVQGSRRRPHDSGAGMNPHQHGQPLAGRGCRCPHVEIEAVLTPVPEAGVEDLFGCPTGTALHTGGGELIGRAHPLPGDDRLRRTPTPVPHRRRGKGDSTVLPNSPSPPRRAAHQPALDLDWFPNGGRERQRQQGREA